MNYNQYIEAAENVLQAARTANNTDTDQALAFNKIAQTYLELAKEKAIKEATDGVKKLRDAFLASNPNPKGFN